jgi:hypothetical protein
MNWRTTLVWSTPSSATSSTTSTVNEAVRIVNGSEPTHNHSLLNEREDNELTSNSSFEVLNYRCGFGFALCRALSSRILNHLFVYHGDTLDVPKNGGILVHQGS